MDSKSTEKDISSWDLWTGDTVHIGDLWKKEFDLSKLYGFMGHSRYCYYVNKFRSHYIRENPRKIALAEKKSKTKKYSRNQKVKIHQR